MPLKEFLNVTHINIKNAVVKLAKNSKETAQNNVRLGVSGCTGAVGRLVVKQVLEHKSCSLAGGMSSPGGEDVGRDMMEVAGGRACGIKVIDDPCELFAKSDVVIDFSVPDASARNTEVAAEQGVPLVLATTGLSDDQMLSMAQAAARVAILCAPNLSPGMAVLRALVATAATALGDDYDAEILTLAHRRKRDAPSGGALELGRVIAAARQIDLETNEIRVRDGDVGPRPRGKIGHANLRGGSGSGEHTAIFAGDWERLELTHRVMSRELYAAVAIRAALWLHGREPRLYNIDHVLGLEL